MIGPRRRPAVTTAASCALVAALQLVLAGPVAGRDPATDNGSTRPLEWALLEAETALGQREWSLAESHYRTAAREAGRLLGLLAVLDDDLPEARAFLDPARNVAAADLAATRMTRALVMLRQGEVEEPLRELRQVVDEDVTDTDRLTLFVRALAATGRDEEYRSELAALGTLDLPAADALATRLAKGERPPLPSVPLGSLADTDDERRAGLQGRLLATLQRVRRNLDALAVANGTTDSAAPGAEPSPATGSMAGDTPFGTMDLGAAFPALGAENTIAPYRLSPVALMASAPPALRPAIVMLDRDDTAGATTALRTLIEDDGATAHEAAAARALLGTVLVRDGDLEAAEAVLTPADDAGSGAVAQALARLYWHTDRRDLATDQLRRAAEARTLDRDLTTALAAIEEEAEAWPAARRQLVSLDKRYGSVEALLRLSAISERSGETKRAFDEADRAVRAAPNAEAVLRRHAELALATGVVSSAARSVEPLVRMRPARAAYRLLLGETWAARHKMGEAVEALLEADRLSDGTLVDAYRALGLALNHESRFAEATDFLTRYLGEHPGDLDALAGLAEAEERLGEVDRAEARVMAVLARHPRHPRANLILGMIRTGRGDFGAARSPLETAAEGDRWLAKAHYQLSLACARLGDRTCATEALARYKKALEGPESAVVVLDAAPATTMMRKQDPPS